MKILLIVLIAIFSVVILFAQPGAIITVRVNNVPNSTLVRLEPEFDYTKNQIYGAGNGVYIDSSGIMLRYVYGTTHKVRETFIQQDKDRILIGAGICIMRIGFPDTLRLAIENNITKNVIGSMVIRPLDISTITHRWVYGEFNHLFTIHQTCSYNFVVSTNGGNASNCYVIRRMQGGGYADGYMQYMTDGAAWANADSSYDVPFYVLRIQRQ